MCIYRKDLSKGENYPKMNFIPQPRQTHIFSSTNNNVKNVEEPYKEIPFVKFMSLCCSDLLCNFIFSLFFFLVLRFCHCVRVKGSICILCVFAFQFLSIIWRHLFLILLEMKIKKTFFLCVPYRTIEPHTPKAYHFTLFEYSLQFLEGKKEKEEILLFVVVVQRTLFKSFLM